MRSLFGLFVVVLFLAGAFAGCMSNNNPPPAANTTNKTAVSNATVDDGTTPMNASVGAMPHTHDYWQGKERITIMDSDVEIDQFTALAFTFFDTFSGTPGVGGQQFDFPQGSLVYEGTGKMEIKPTWTDPTITGAGLRYRSPSDEQYGAALPLTQGTPITLDIKPEMTDMAHDKESRWHFLLMPSAPGQVMYGKIHFHVDIVRMRDVSLMPGHPQLFGADHTLTLFSGAATSTSESFAERIAGFATNNQQDSGVRSSKVVPMETLSMTANVTITDATSNIGKVSNISFLYHPAGGGAFGQRSLRAQVISADFDKGVFQFGWPVNMTQTDSPYAKTSEWTFDLLIRTDPTGNGSQMQGLSDAKVTYNLEVVAYDSMAAGITPPQKSG